MALDYGMGTKVSCYTAERVAEQVNFCLNMDHLMLGFASTNVTCSSVHLLTPRTRTRTCKGNILFIQTYIYIYIYIYIAFTIS